MFPSGYRLLSSPNNTSASSLFLFTIFLAICWAALFRLVLVRIGVASEAPRRSLLQQFGTDTFPAPKQLSCFRERFFTLLSVAYKIRYQNAILMSSATY